MRVLVTGGRDYEDVERVAEVLGPLGITELAEGGANGADFLAAQWAAANGVPVRSFPADWETYGRRAGPIRNQQMLDEFHPQLVIAFPGGRGTADMTRRARAAGVPVLEVR